MKRTVLIWLIMLVLFSGMAYSAEKKEYTSPDGRYIAYVVTVSESSESKVVVQTSSGALICTKSYTSKDGEHGFGVQKAMWTPDSNFFVYTLSSSGGHQPWHFPVELCSVRHLMTRRLDDYVGPITSPDLETRSPDMLKGKKLGQNIDDQVDFEVRLSGIEKQGTKK